MGSDLVDVPQRFPRGSTELAVLPPILFGSPDEHAELRRFDQVRPHQRDDVRRPRRCDALKSEAMSDDLRQPGSANCSIRSTGIRAAGPP